MNRIVCEWYKNRIYKRDIIEVDFSLWKIIMIKMILEVNIERLLNKEWVYSR